MFDHNAAIHLHHACLQALRRLDLVGDGLAIPIGGLYTEESEYEMLALQAWAVSAKLLGIRDNAKATLGTHLDAIHAHQDAMDGDRWAREESGPAGADPGPGQHGEDERMHSQGR